MKKVILVFTILLFITILSACGAKDNTLRVGMDLPHCSRMLLLQT